MFHNQTDFIAFCASLAAAIGLTAGIELYYRKKLRPQKLTIQEMQWRTVIQYRWVQRHHCYLLFYGAICIVILPVGIYFTQIELAHFLDCLWATVAVMAGLVLIAGALRGFVNQTLLHVTGNTIVITSKPWPTLHRRHQSTGNVKKIYYRKEINNRRSDFGWVYCFYADTETAHEVKILDMVDLENDAIEIEQAIARQIQQTLPPTEIKSAQIGS